MLSKKRADAFAAKLDIGLDVGICHACLSFVAFALEAGEPHEIAREVRRVTVDLWHDGLDRQALRSVEQACGLGVTSAQGSEVIVESEQDAIYEAFERVIFTKYHRDLRTDV